MLYTAPLAKKRHNDAKIAQLRTLLFRLPLKHGPNKSKK